MRNEIEFHDSRLIAINHKGASIHIQIDAYVHRWQKFAGKWMGIGRAQPVEITIANATCVREPTLPADLDGGDIRVGQIAYDNMVPLPFIASGPVTLRLELKSANDAGLVVDGENITINESGSGRYMEELPDEFRPADLHDDIKPPSTG